MTTTSKRPRTQRYLSLGLLAVMLAGTCAATVVVRNLVHDQNDQLLQERAAEAGLFLSSTMSSTKPTLLVLGATYAADPSHAVATTLTKSFSGAQGNAVAIATVADGRAVVRVAGGKGIAANQPLTGARAALAERAIREKDLVTDLISSSKHKGSVLAFAVSLPNGIVVYQEVKLDPAQLTTTSKGNSPFSELEGAVYAAPTVQASKLLFSTAPKLPLHGAIATRPITIGADHWVLQATARGPLVGSFAAAAPWIVFVLGVLLSLVAFAAADLLLRRRAYALALVDERTAELREAMTDLEATRESAVAANRAKSEFLSRMSHELRTPLNAVLGFAQVLEMGDLNESERQSVTQITKGGQHLLELINDVLDISRIETGNLTLSSEPVLVDDAVEDVLDLVEPLAAQRHIRCRAIPGNGDTYVLADRQRLKQVLLNLLANAVKYNHPGGTVAVSCEVVGDRVRIKVADNGPGIPAGKRDRLFEPFERLGADQTNVEGAGIGLALSLRLAEAMGGVLDVESVEGEGSTFWIELTLTEGPVERHQRTTGGAAVMPPRPETNAQHTMLYIEDNLANIKLIEHVLAYRPEIHLITALQGRLGVEIAEQHLPEMILLDLHLPDMGGEAVLAELRANPETSQTPIVVLTADATERQHAGVIAAGATAYVTKPIDVRQLLELVDAHLAHLTPATPVRRQRV